MPSYPTAWSCRNYQNDGIEDPENLEWEQILENPENLGNLIDGEAPAPAPEPVEPH